MEEFLLATATLKAALKWWDEEAKHLTTVEGGEDDWDEYNVFDEDPDWVREARKLLNVTNQGGDMKIHLIHGDGIDITICESCMKGEHQSYGHDHRDGSEGRRDCKNVGILDGKIVQCTCGG